MLKTVIDAIAREFNPGLCLRDIRNHWACRCTVPGPGMHQAAALLRERYRENGAVEAQVFPYPADDRTEWLDGRRNPLEWQPHAAELSVVAPTAGAGMICRYADEPLCLISNSRPTAVGGVEAELVIHLGPLASDSVQEGQWAGRILLTDQFPSTVAAAAHRAGCLGLVSDCVCPPWLTAHPPVREPQDVPDLVMWTIFSGRRNGPPLFGFNLSPRQGWRLRALARGSAEPLRLRALVDTALVEGVSDLAHGALPGTDLAQEDVWLLAHLSEPGARDNASGCCLGLELARVLARLTASGALPPLRRTIRFLNATEVEGFLPFIHEHRERLDQVVAGLCCDSAGQDFALCGGEAVLFLSPEHNASFVDGLMQVLLDAAAAEPVARFSTDNYAIFPWHAEPFFGNDAFISDGYFDIPTPQVSTWPDRYYHSNQDLPHQICTNTLGRMAVAFGSFLYLMATAGAAEARWLARLAVQDWKRRIGNAVNAALVQGGSPPERLASQVRHLALQAQDAVMQTARFAPADQPLAAELTALCARLAEWGEIEARQAWTLCGGQGRAPRRPLLRGPGLERIPRRCRWSPPALVGEQKEQLERLSAGGVNLARIWPWINGRRNLGEIAERLVHDGPIPVACLQAYLDLLGQAGAVEFRA
jgi:hypothetical protein